MIGSWSGSSPTRRARALALFFATSTVAALEEREVALERHPLTAGIYRLAAGMGGELPREARSAWIGERTYLFFDLDANGDLEPGVDGLALAGHPFIVKLPPELLVSDGQYTFAFEGLQRLRLEPGPELSAEILRHTGTLTELRLRAGVPPLVLDEEASAAAEQHLDYLATNRIIRGRLTLDAHREDPRKPGYSVDGARAGKLGLLGTNRNLSEDALGWFASTFHGAVFLDPELRVVGLARKHGVSLLYPVGWDEAPRRRSAEFVVHPPDGARAVPPGFCPGGEVPSPVPGRTLGRGNGFPVTVRLSPAFRRRELLNFELHDAAGNEVPGFVSTPREPATSSYPNNAGCAFFVPRARLEDGTDYTASFRMVGMERPLVWTFRTWEWEPPRR